MKERAQPIRPTQFITTYGPGAILESLRGPRLITSIENSGLFETDSPSKYEIKEPALSQQLPENGRIFRLPTNGDYGLEDSKAIYQTRAFPSWSLCAKHSLLYRARPNTRKACPRCDAGSEWESWSQARRQAISFVMACPRGHLDDVSWSFLLHQGAGRTDCMPDTIDWIGSGGPIRRVLLRCPKCSASVRLGDIYHREHTCSGRFPEEGEGKRAPASCQTKARISQRAASDLYLPEIRTALTLPAVDSPLHAALRDDSVFSVLEAFLQSRDSLEEKDWEAIVGGSRVPSGVKDEIFRADLDDRLAAAKQVLKEGETTTKDQARAGELDILLKASRSECYRSANFELDPAGAREFPLANLCLRVTPVTRLRLVAAQIGYRRLNGEVVEKGFEYLKHLWFPGIEQYGEGIFLELAAVPPMNGPRWRSWLERFEQEGEASGHPMLVWWHTLSHRLIRALSVDSGYSAASVRERLYFDGERGGVLIYAVQPGGDGTLGGLVALVPRFDRILRSALDRLDGCSNDPLCGEQKVGESRKNGAVCYACGLLSETSCEMRNMLLDRNLLLETLA